MNIPSYSLKNPKVIYFFLAVLLIGGVLSFGKLGKKEDAPFVIKQAMIFAFYPGATAQETEQLVTEVIERELQTMPNIDYIKSETYSGMSKISLVLLPKTPPADIEGMWDILRRKVLNLQSSVPRGTYISVNDDFGDVFGIYYGLKADEGFTHQELRDWAQKIKQRLSTVDGVQRVTISGEQTPIVNVNISLAKLANLGIDPNQIIQIMSSQNQLLSPGNKMAGKLEVQIFADGAYESIDDIRNQLITTNTGAQIRLGDIATVEFGYKNPPTTLMKINGEKSLGIAIASPGDKDVVKTGQNVEEVLNEIRKEMPIGIELTTLYSESDIASAANKGFILNLIISVLIVIVILMFIMGFKASVLIGSSLIFSISGTLLIMEFMGVGLNRTSLAGFIIAMGMLVDNAIVVTDNTQIAMKRGVSKRDAIINGAVGPQIGLLGATLIAIFSFLPLFLAEESVAEIVKPLFIVIGVSLGLSWILALAQTTTFANFMFKENKNAVAIDPYDKPFYYKFERFLKFLLRHRWSTVLTMVGMLYLSAYVMGKMPQNFFPALEKEYFRSDFFFPNGYNIRQTEKEMDEIEAWLLNQPSVVKVSTTLGSVPPRYYLASSSFGPLPSFANMLIELNSKDSTEIVEDRFNTYVRENFPNINIKSSLFKVAPPAEATIEIGYEGANIDTLIMLTDKIQDIMRNYDGVDQVRSSWGAKVPVLLPSFSQTKGQELAVTRNAVSQSLTIATNGITLGDFRQNDQFLPIMLKDVNADNFSLSDLNTIPVFSAKGNIIPLSQVTDNMKFEYDYYNIKRYNRERYMLAQCEPKRGYNTAQAFKDIMAEVDKLDVPDGYVMTYFGEQESQKRSNKALADKMPLTFILMFIVLLLLFKSYKKPAVILAMLPLIFIGVVLGLLVMNKMFDFFCLLGILGLIGMNIKNAIVLIDQIHIEKKAGLSYYDAVVTATKSRLVPVTMASGTTILGMLPLLPDAMFGGMAATIMGGLLAATILTIFILPVTFCLFFGIKTPKAKTN
ncbi:MAG: efflux RND transporter permease subunit [Rikenellaceae bacterium]